MSTLPTTLRRQLENACKQARTIAGNGARKALESLAVHEPNPYRHMDAGQCGLRCKLQAQAQQLGDGQSQTRRGAYEIKHLVEKLAYDQWHRLLFARFLMENNLLISPEHGVSVTLDDCEELAPSLGLKDAWAVAARFAAKELPGIFRADDPAGAVELPVEDRNPLIQLVTGLPVEVFTASDSLGWCYQFWQAERKDEVNAAGNKIGADELPAVTQLFTEDYMVDFLLDNTLGAWHAGKVLAAKPTLAETAQSEEELRNAVALPECPWRYLRFIKAEDGKWTPAAGTFDGWPKTAKELKCLDPCMGSGHFVVAMFERLAALRTAEEKLDEAATVAAVIRDNLFGLEIDPRCTQIAAFNLALAAWRRVGHCKLPAMNLACSGVAPNTREAHWLAIAGDNQKLRNGMEQLYQLFKDAPVLGSLINPGAAESNLLVAAFHELQPLLEKALSQETKNGTAHEMAVTAQGLAKAAELLAGQFTLVATNVPYLARGKYGEAMKDHIERHFNPGKENLATAFVLRCTELSAPGGTSALVSLQTWLFLTSYKQLRIDLLRRVRWNLVAGLGTHAFSTPMWDFHVMLIALTRGQLVTDGMITGFDVASEVTPEGKAFLLRTVEPESARQADQLSNPEAGVGFGTDRDTNLLSQYATFANGIQTGDRPRFVLSFWETPYLGDCWRPLQSTVEATTSVGGLSFQIRWDAANRSIPDAVGSVVRGAAAWNRLGVCVSAMGDLPVATYSGQLYDENCVVLIPKTAKDLPSLWCYCSSELFKSDVRKICKALKVRRHLIAVPFDLARWQRVAEKKYPHGLPTPFSSDPTQWLLNGHPKGSDQSLHVAVARLLGYQWPRQTGSSFPGCPALDPDHLENFADRDGIVCLSSTKGEAAAAERLRVVLVQALGKFDINALIASAGLKGSKSETLEEWLRDEFFEQHCALFDHRPFIWHIWDGHKSGFSALVNYRKLTHANLEKLTYAYLGDWIRRQQAAVDAGEAGRDVPLQAAKQLQSRLKLILEGEPPYDLFVRWKPLSKQATGWRPDINDGVRMNIRPFATADILRKRVKIKWDKDRGNEPVRDKKEFPWFWGWDEEKQDFAGVGNEPDGNRWNDCHYTNEFKKRAREANKPR